MSDETKKVFNEAELTNPTGRKIKISIKDGTISSSKLSDGAVTLDKLGSDVKNYIDYSANNNVNAVTILSLVIEDGYTTWRAGQGYIATIAAYATKGKYDITDAQDRSQFRWSRKSIDAKGDKAWTEAHMFGAKVLKITELDMAGDTTTFICTLYKKNGEIETAKEINFSL